MFEAQDVILRAVMDSVPALLAYVDNDFRYVWVNKCYQDWYGINPEAMLGCTVQTVVGGKAWHFIQPYLERARAAESVSFECLIPHINGQRHWVKGNYIPDMDAKGVVKGIVVYIMDVSDQKHSEQQVIGLNQTLQQRVEEMQVIFDTVPIGLAISYDTTGEHIRGNRVNERMLGLPPNSELSRRNNPIVSYRVLYETRELQVDELPMQRAIRGETVVGQRLDIVRPDGQQLTLLANAVPLLNESGQPRGAVGTFQDITVFKELQHTQERLKLIVEKINAGYWDWDIRKDLLYTSSECNQQLGIDPCKNYNHPDAWRIRVHPNDLDRVLTATQQYIEGQLPHYELEYRMRHETGSYRWIQTRGALVYDQDQQPIRLLGINLDITDYQKTREINQQREQMEEVFRLHVASQTAAAIAHELNQPLTAIAHYADIAQELLHTTNPPMQKLAEIMGKCQQQALRVSVVIRELLVVLHKGEILSEPVDINQEIHTVIQFVNETGLIGAVNLELVFADDLPLVKVNRLQLHKVLINLLMNSWEVLQDGRQSMGVIRIATQCACQFPGSVLVTVSDNGKGVADVVLLNSIFQPFHSTKPHGLGMGLTISRALIEAQGGHMWAEQNTDAGLSIYFILPFMT